nr:hypothetical protein [Tanacetum cinerariifolium]
MSARRSEQQPKGRHR